MRSARAAPALLRRRLEGDLDKILLKALDKDPARRYRSVAQFSEDVRRHLEGLPVAAREATYRYRAGKFVRRHRFGVAAAILIAVAQQIGFVTTVWEIRVKVPTALAAGAGVDVRPELVSSDLSRTGALPGGRLRQPRPALARREFDGWRRDLLGLRDDGPDLDEMAIVCRPATLDAGIAPALHDRPACTGDHRAGRWRIARRFGWRGMAAFVVVVSIGGPIRERVDLWAAHLMAVAPGTIAWIANTLSWTCALLLSHSIMRLIAGPARDDRLAWRRWIPRPSVRSASYFCGPNTGGACGIAAPSCLGSDAPKCTPPGPLITAWP